MHQHYRDARAGAGRRNRRPGGGVTEGRRGVFRAGAEGRGSRRGVYRGPGARGWEGRKRRDEASLIMSRYRPLDPRWRGKRIAWQSTGSNSIAYSKRRSEEHTS